MSVGWERGEISYGGNEFSKKKKRGRKKKKMGSLHQHGQGLKERREGRDLLMGKRQGVIGLRVKI